MNDLDKLNTKFTREDGTDCWSGTLKYEVGKKTEAPNWDRTPACGRGLHFGKASSCITALTRTPDKVFEVEPEGEVVEIQPGIKKVKTLLVLRELSISQVLQELAKDGNPDVREVVAENPNTSKETLKELSKDRLWRVRAAVAKNPNTPKEILEVLAEDIYWGVRQAVAKNSNTPKELLEVLAKDEDWCVRAAIAKNPNTSKETLEVLTKDKDLDVRTAVTKNPHTSKIVLSI